MLRFQKQQNLKKDYFGKKDDTDRLFAQLKFSREQELDADAQGLELYLQSGYDPQEAASALQMLELSNDDEEDEKTPFSLDLTTDFSGRFLYAVWGFQHQI